MKKYSIMALFAAVMSTMLTGCGDLSNIGSSIVSDQVEIVVDSSFTVTAQSVPIERVQSRTISQLLGRIDAKGFGMMSSDIVTQFMPASQMLSSEITVNDIDSLVLYLTMTRGEYVGDSVVPMGLDVYRLTKNLPSPIYSDFDPAGYYDNGATLASAIYNVTYNSTVQYADTVYKDRVEIGVRLPDALGRELYTSYLNNPSNFLSPTAFSDNVFKGLYIKNSFGSGRLIRAYSTKMTMYYHHYDAEKDTTIVGKGNYFAVTPEIISNNDVKFEISPEVQQMIDNGAHIVMAPVGREVRMRFPAPEIIAAYKRNADKASILNTLTFQFPAEGVVNDYGISLPTYLLMVLEKDKEKFFANNSLPDNVTSFYATYSSNIGGYSFGDVRNFILDLMKKESITEEDYTFTIMPVSCVFETTQQSYYSTSQVLSLMTPYMAAPVMGNLFLDKAKIKLAFSTHSAPQGK